MVKLEKNDANDGPRYGFNLTNRDNNQLHNSDYIFKDVSIASLLVLIKGNTKLKKKFLTSKTVFYTKSIFEETAKIAKQFYFRDYF